MRKKTTYLILMLICIVGFWAFENFYTPDTYTDKQEATNDHRLAESFLPSSTTGIITHHNYFSLSYNEAYEQAEWVAYTLDRKQLTQDDRKRPYFIEDPKIKTKSADWRNYKRSGYDRGHLCPAGDRRFSKPAYNETFYTSNISPQQNKFNAGVWNRLEQKVRYWAKKNETIFIVTGGVLEEGLASIGEEDVAIPKSFYKIVAKGKGNDVQVLAFLMPHKESSQPLNKFLVSVDAIEKLTGIDFFQKLPDTLQKELESTISTKGWKL